MSCVEDTNAPIMNAAIVNRRKWLDGIVNAIMAKQATNSSCDIRVHLRLVLTISTMGLHRGLMVQGINSMLVYMAISASPIPMSLYMMSEIDVIA